MKLLTKEIREKLPALYVLEHEKDPMVYVKFFELIQVEDGSVSKK